MPNGTTHGFGIQGDDLRRLLKELPPEAAVAFVLCTRAPQYSAMTADGLRQLLREYTGRGVVIERQSPALYILRVVPPLIFVRPESPLFSRISKAHPGGLHIFHKTDLDRMLGNLRGDSVVGDLLTAKESRYREDLSSATLLAWLHDYVDSAIFVMAQDDSSFMLEFTPELRGLHQLVCVPSDSYLASRLHLLDVRQKRRE